MENLVKVSTVTRERHHYRAAQFLIPMLVQAQLLILMLVQAQVMCSYARDGVFPTPTGRAVYRYGQGVSIIRLFLSGASASLEELSQKKKHFFSQHKWVRRLLIVHTAAVALPCRNTKYYSNSKWFSLTTGGGAVREGLKGLVG